MSNNARVKIASKLLGSKKMNPTLYINNSDFYHLNKYL